MAYEEKEYASNIDIKIWKKIIPYAKVYKRTFIKILVLICVCAAVDILFPLFQSYALDNFVQTQNLNGIVVFVAAYAVTILVQLFSVIAFTRASMRMEMWLGRDLKKHMFYHLQTLSLSYYNVTPVGYALSRIMSDTTRIATLVAWSLPDLMWSVFYIFGVFIAMFLLNPGLALVIIIVMPAISLLTFYFQNKILHWNRKVRRNQSKITSAFNEGIMGAKTSKTLVIEKRNFDEFEVLTKEMYVSGVKSSQLSAIYIPLVVFVSSVLLAVVLTRGGFLVHEQLLGIGVLSAFVSYALGIFEPVQQMARILADIISMQAEIERVVGLLEEKPIVVDTKEVVEKYGDCFNPKTEAFEKINGDITFDNVTFMYPDGKVNVLENFNLHVKAGETIAIVGETGAGKSTLVNLACRFFEPTSGKILIDGVDYKKRSQLWLHSNIGYVLQSPQLFSGTVMDNIRYGRLDATDEEVFAAAKAAYAHEVVEKLEYGYDTKVGEGGDHLSTGEKQLISFARAVLANPRIFVLDEATSSIDTHTEQLIQAAIAHILRDRTSFLIAHRLSTIRHAHKILVVKDGKIIDTGTHTQLMAKKGYYFELYSKQFEEESAMKVLK